MVGIPEHRTHHLQILYFGQLYWISQTIYLYSISNMEATRLIRFGVYITTQSYFVELYFHFVRLYIIILYRYMMLYDVTFYYHNRNKKSVPCFQIPLRYVKKNKKIKYSTFRVTCFRFNKGLGVGTLLCSYTIYCAVFIK